MQKMIVAACMRISAAKLGIAKRAHHGNQCAQQPHTQGPTDIATQGGDQRRGLEDTGTDHHAQDQGDSAQRVEQPLRLLGRTRLTHRRRA